MESKIFLLVFAIMVSNSDGRSLQKRAAFYIANETACVVDNTVYYNGDPIPTDDPCEACKCRPPGFACVLKDCEVKPGCRAVRRAGHCCPDYVCDPTANGSFPTEPSSKSSTTDDRAEGSTYPYQKPITTPLPLDEDVDIHTPSVIPSTEGKRYSESSVEYFDTATETSVTTEKRLDDTDAVTLEYEKEQISGDQEVDEEGPQDASDGNAGIADSVSPVNIDASDTDGGQTEISGISKIHTQKDKSPDQFGSRKTAYGSKPVLNIDSEVKPGDPVDPIAKPDEPNEKDLDSSLPEEVKNNDPVESTTIQINEDEGKVSVSETLDKYGLHYVISTPPAEEPQEEHTTFSHPDTTTFAQPIPLVYLQRTKVDGSKKSQSSIDNDLNQDAQGDGVQPDANDSEANEILLTTQSTDEENLLSPKGASESDRKGKEKADTDDETSIKEDTTEKPKESDVEKNETKQDRGLKTVSKDKDVAQDQQVQQQQPDASSTTLDLQQLSTPSSVQEIQADESKQQEIPKEERTDSNRQSVKTVSKIQNNEETQKVQTQDSVDRAPEITAQDQQQPAPSAQVTKSEEIPVDQEQQQVQNVEQVNQKSEYPNKSEENEKNQAKEDRSVKTASSASKEKEPQKIQHQYEITQPSVETTSDKTEQFVSAPQQIDEATDEVEQELPSEEKQNIQEENQQEDTEADLKIETVSKVSTTTTQEPKQEIVTTVSIEPTASDSNEPQVISAGDEKLSDSVGEVKQKTVNKKGIIHEGEENESPDNVESSKQDRSVKTASKTEAQTTVQNDGIASSHTEFALEDQQLSTPVPQSTNSKQKNNEDQRFPTWEEISHKHTENDRISEPNSREQKGIKIGNTAESDEDRQKTEQQSAITLPPPETTVDESELLTTTFQNVQSEDSITKEQEETEDTEGAIQNPEKLDDSDAQDDTKNGEDVKTASQEEAQEPEQQLDDVTPLPTETILDEAPPPTVLTRKTKPKRKTGVETEDLKQDRSVKTPNTNQQEAQEAPQHSDITATATESVLEESQQVTNPPSTETKNKVKNNDESSFPSWDEIHHKSDGNRQIGAIIHHESRQDRSIKTGASKVSDTVTPDAEQQEESTPSSQEIVTHDNDSSGFILQTTKSADDGNEQKPESGNQKEIALKSEQYGIKGGVAQRVSEEDQPIDTASNEESETGTPEPERLDDNTPHTTETANLDEQLPNAEQEKTKKDRSVKTGAVKTVQQENISTATTEVVLDEQQQLTTASSQKVKPKDQKEQKFPSWEEINYKHEARDAHSRQSRSAKTASSSSSDEETGTKAPEVTESTSVDFTFNDYTEPTLEIQDVKSEDIVDEEKADTSKKGFFQKSEQHENKDNIGTDESKQDRSVKTATKDAAQTEDQEAVKQDAVTPSSTVTFTEQIFDPQSHASGGKNSEQPRFPTWEEISYKHEINSQISRQARSAKTSSKGSGETSPQQEEQQNDVTAEPFSDSDETSSLTPQDIKSEGNVESQNQETADEIVSEPEEPRKKDSLKTHEPKQDRSVKTGTKTGAQGAVKQGEIIVTSTNPPSQGQQISNSRYQTSKEKNRERPRFPTWEEISRRYERKSQKTATRQDENVKATNDGLSGIQTQTGEQQTVASPETSLSDTTTAATPEPQNIEYEGGVGEKDQVSEQRIKTVIKSTQTENQSTVDQEKPKEDRSVKTGSKGTSQAEEQQTPETDDTSSSPTQAILSDQESSTPAPPKKQQEEQRFPSWEEINHKSGGSGNSGEIFKQERGIKTDAQKKKDEQQEEIAPQSQETTPDSYETDAQKKKDEQQEEIVPQSQEITPESYEIDSQRKKDEQQEEIALQSQETTPDYYETSTTSPSAGIQSSLEEDNQKPANDQEIIREPQENEDRIRPEVSRKGRDIKTSGKTVSETNSQESVQNEDVKSVLNQSLSEAEQQTTPDQNTKSEESKEQEFPQWEEIIRKSERKFRHILEHGGPKRIRSVKTGSNRVSGTGVQSSEQQFSVTSPPQETTLVEQFTSVSQNEAQQLEEQNNVAVVSQETAVVQEQLPSSPEPQITLSKDQSKDEQEQQIPSEEVITDAPSNQEEQADTQEVKKVGSIKHRSIKTSGKSPAPEIQTSGQYDDAVQTTATVLIEEQTQAQALHDAEDDSAVTENGNKETSVYTTLTDSISDEDANQSQSKIVGSTTTSSVQVDVNENGKDSNRENQKVEEETVSKKSTKT